VDSFVPGGHAIATDDVALLREVEVTHSSLCSPSTTPATAR
jgi:hypothetical protein